MIAFASRTGNVRYIVNKLGLPHIEIVEGLEIVQPFLLFTYTDGLGQIPSIVKQFLLQNHKYCKGVIASGNSNFGQENFCKSADAINGMYHIPIIRKIDLRGFQSDYDAIVAYYNNVIGLVGV